MKPRATTHLLVDTLRVPEIAFSYGVREWEALVWQSRSAELMAQLYVALDKADVLAAAPAAARRHLTIAKTIADKHTAAIESELIALREALEPLGMPVVLLKGAAYCGLQHHASLGRLFNDIDIMVPKHALAAAEERLLWAGWLPSHTSAYDQRYYRNWMHEIPPLEHKHRATVLDVHHTILPPTSGIKPDPKDLFEASIPLSGNLSFFRVLGRADMVIHSACHLFFGEFHKGLRDLHDLHLLLSDFGAEEQFWRDLVARANALNLALPLLDALTQCNRLYHTQVPARVFADLGRLGTSPYPTFLRNWLFEHALRPVHTSAFGWTTWLAHRAVFVRSHWLRMPLPLLLYHLTYKVFFTK
ncbi:nucleotidyltransferase family protein [Rhodoferax sp. GW822-FHT02A01]|uniref:nucleotidyltransferase family protein n=1 Tax=Rhodoferax sp. GW822-FHT02A01 TaxID=3141537 RepID=UPI00315D19E5